MYEIESVALFLVSEHDGPDVPKIETRHEKTHIFMKIRQGWVFDVRNLFLTRHVRNCQKLWYLPLSDVRNWQKLGTMSETYNRIIAPVYASYNNYVLIKMISNC